MKHLFLLWISTLSALACSGLACNTTAMSSTAPARRSFAFEYATTVSGFPTDTESVRVWIPVPVSDETQEISNVEIEAPVPYELETEELYGNRLAYFELESPIPEELPITLRVTVERKEISWRAEIPGSVPRERLLAGDRLAPIDAEAQARAERATRGVTGVVEEARGIYRQVLADVDYDKSGQGWGRGDLQYVCAAGKGNCSDFHALFIAMARARNIPAVFEIGFPIPPNAKEGVVGGYHCWAWYEDESGSWHPVDASEADKDPSKTDYYFGTICANRVAFSRGRDIVLEPPQNGTPVNFLVYPYVEVDGNAGTAKVENHFRFEEL